MKKSFFIIAAIVIAAATAITVSSCKKDKTEEGNTNETVAKNYELSDMDKAMIAFGEKMKAASDERSGETMPLAEALNTLSNYQNYTMCDASHYSTEMVTDTFTASLNVTGGEVLLSELNNIYETTKPEILSIFNSLEGNQKAIYSIRSVVNNSQRTGLENYSGTLDVKIITRSIDSIRPIMPNPFTFDTTAYWFEFDSMGKCAHYFYSFLGRDCVTEINSKMKTLIGNLGCGDGYSMFFTNIEQYEFNAKQISDLSSPNGRYAWPWRGSWDGIQCVSPDEMNYYLNKVKEKYDQVENSTTKTIINIDFIEEYLPLSSEWISKAIIEVADVNCTPNLPDE